LNPSARNCSEYRSPNVKRRKWLASKRTVPEPRRMLRPVLPKRTWVTAARAIQRFVYLNRLEGRSESETSNCPPLGCATPGLSHASRPMNMPVRGCSSTHRNPPMDPHYNGFRDAQPEVGLPTSRRLAPRRRDTRR
jgi:hypothetical protein